MRGVVKWFNTKKGYGFITGDDGAGDFFVHHTMIRGDGFKTLQEGDRVDFIKKETDRGMAADLVTLIK